MKFINALLLSAALALPASVLASTSPAEKLEIALDAMYEDCMNVQGDAERSLIARVTCSRQVVEITDILAQELIRRNVPESFLGN